MKIEDEFRRRYRDVDAVVVSALWDVWRRLKDDRPQRANIETALGRLQERAELARFASDPRRSMAP